VPTCDVPDAASGVGTTVRIMQEHLIGGRIVQDLLIVEHRLPAPSAAAPPE
jgi:(2Fe-2S) ferredoxin